MWLDVLVGKAHYELLTNPLAAPARDYLARRGVSEADWKTYQLGWSSPRIEIGECSAEFAAWFPRHWFERLVFPLMAATGETIGVQTRGLDVKFYPQFGAYPSDVYPYVFGLQTALQSIWETRQAVIVEGVFDFFAVKGTAPNTIAVLGAGVPVTCKRFLRRYARRVTVLFDMDAAGRQGAVRLQDYPEGFTVVAPWYPAHDPDDLVKMPGGRERLASLLQHTQARLP